MSIVPSFVHIREEGPREGFQIEPGPIATSDKIPLIDALGDTGLTHIQTVSFVNPIAVPGWSDVNEVVCGMRKREGVEYTALWFNERGLQQALAHRYKLHVTGALIVSASELFSQKNLNRSREEHLAVTRQHAVALAAAGVAIKRVGVMAAFGCNYAGDVDSPAVLNAAQSALDIAAEAGESLAEITLADTMGWCTPLRTERLVDAIRSKWPVLEIILHLHDTRGMEIASARAALRMGVTRFDTTVAGLGGCPFTGRPSASGNIATEELVLLCEEIGIATGVDLAALIEVARMAERIVVHTLPSTLLRAGSFAAASNSAQTACNANTTAWQPPSIRSIGMATPQIGQGEFDE